MAPFEAFGYTVSKLKVDDKGCRALERVDVGTSLLELPLDRCWSAAAVELECAPLAQALLKAERRGAEYSAISRMALHLIWEYRQLNQNPETAPTPSQEHRRKHLELLGGPGRRKAETLLAWGRRDLDSLQGSFWFEEAHRRQDDVLADLHSLVADLGSQVAAALGLVEGTDVARGCVEVYAWARWILEEWGMQFLVPGDALNLLAPGLELVPRDAGGGNTVLRLNLEGRVLVLAASAPIQAGEEVRLWHKGFACSQGFRLLLGVDNLKVPEQGEAAANPWDSVDVLLRLPVTAKNTSENAQLWGIIEALEAALQASRPWQEDELLLGDALPPDYGWRRVEVLQKDQQPETALPSQEDDEVLEVQVRMPLSATMPTAEALQQLGLLICADVDRMQKLMKEEKGVLDPLGPEACRRRALTYLQRTLQWVLEEYPSHAATDARQLSRKAEAALPRRVRGLLLVSHERELLASALSALSSAELTKDVPEEDTLYSLDWDDGVDGKEVGGHAHFRGVQDSPKNRPKTAEGPSQTGATWEDLALEPLLGFSLPVLCDVRWRHEPLLPPAYARGLRPTKPGYVEDESGAIFPPVPKERPTEKSPGLTENALPSSAASLRWGLLELRGGAAPRPEVVTALMAVGCQDRLMYFRDRLMVQQKYLARLAAGQSPGTVGAAPVKTSEYDILVIPLEGWLNSSTPEQLSIDLVEALQALIAEMGQSVLRLVLLSSMSIGPGSSYRRDRVAPAAAALGVVRSARAELPQVPLLWLDSDAEGKTFQEQLMYEVDLALPPGGHPNPSSLERAQCIMAHNRDVVYRQGHRWLPRLDLSPNMPVYSGRAVPQLPGDVTQGVALVTGGVGGIGLAAAEALVELGMKCLVLTSREGYEEGASQRLQAMTSRGVDVHLRAMDVAVESKVRELLESIQDYGPLRIVIHASGALEDRPFMDLDAKAFQKVFKPKALGAWYLHRHTLDEKLHSFILCSSVAASRGSAGQANYAAANAYLDELARLRLAQDLPAVSIQWPAVAPWLEEPEEASGTTVWNGVATGLEKKTGTNSISVAAVRQVLKLSVVRPFEPVQAVLPGGYLSSSSPTVRSLLHPLLARRKEPEEKLMGLADKRPGIPISGAKLCLQLT